ncbi:MAG: DEAD/DEAH box helicase [Holophaga sp.]
MAGGRRPYSHQAETANLFLTEGKNVALITPTASGKTISFLAPTLSILLNNPSSTALMLYPMNALAADQLKVLQGIGFKEGENGLFDLPIGDTIIRAGILTGETPAKARAPIRKQANLLITNHVALHHALLAQAGRKYKDGSGWSRFLTAMKIIVLDEGHSYNGVQGTNAALAFRRLSLLVYKLSGAYPQMVMASATIGNARVLCAAPAYVAKRGMPAGIKDLEKHDCIFIRERGQGFGIWKLDGPRGIETVRVSGPLSCSNGEIGTQWALDGHGITLRSTWDVGEKGHGW